MKTKNKVEAVAKCYYCSGVVMSNENYTALTHKQKGHETMAVAHSDWTGCQRATNRTSYWQVEFEPAQSLTSSLSE